MLHGQVQAMQESLSAAQERIAELESQSTLRRKLMIIAVSAAGTDVSAQVDPRFGRCRYFLFFDTDTQKAEAEPNPAGEAGGGAGVQAAQQVANKGAEVVLTGNVGPNAHTALSAAEIAVYTGIAGSIKDAIDCYLSGQLSAAEGPTVSPHHGMRGGQGGA